MISKILIRGSWYLFVPLGMAAVAFATFQVEERFMPPWVRLGVGLVVSILAIWIANHLPLLSFYGELQTEGCENIPSFVAVLLIGTVLRLVWVLLVPPVQTSDALDYWNAARGIVETRSYFFELNGYVARAWRPPGYPFFLAVCMWVLGQNPWIPAVTNIGFYLLSSLVVYSMARVIAGCRVALFATTLLALWPAQVMLTGLACNEVLSFLLFIAALWAFLKPGRPDWLYAMIAGVLTGMGALIRPQLLMLPAVWVVFIAMKTSGRRCTLWRTVVAGAFMIIVIAPWTVRNYHVLGVVIPVSSNGGDVFYRANNPLANGGWTKQGERYSGLDAFKGDEVLWNRTAYTWGIEWIKKNPSAFLKLVFRKQWILLGPDDEGINWAFKATGDKTGLVYEVLVFVSDLWWLAVWILALFGAFRGRRFFVSSPVGGLLFTTIFFFVIIHSVYESQPRHHMPFVGVLLLIASLAISLEGSVSTLNGKETTFI